MNRQHLREQMIRVARQEQRDPVENALYAFLSLSEPQADAMISRFNDIFANRHNAQALSIARFRRASAA